MKTILITSALFACSAIGWGQAGAKKGNDYLGQTWVGLLTSADCGGAKSAGRSHADRAADMTTSGRTTTPPVDASGTRGSATANETSKESPTHDALPRTGDIQSTAKEAVKDPGWGAAKKQAASLAPSCGVTADTSSFSLLLPEGRSIRFDDVANATIAKQLREHNDNANKPVVLRVRVTGKLQNDKIALDSIRM